VPEGLIPAVSEVVRKCPLMGAYYDLGEANERVTELRPLLDALRDDRDAVALAQRHVEQLRSGNGNGRHQAEVEQRQEEMTAIVRRMEAAVRQIDAWGITLRDIGTGLVDFPALVNGRPIWLCWKLGEGEIAWWHELDAGIAGRKPLIEME
jgi:hypothetical protein